MKIISGRLGEVEINPAEVITIPDGIIGFPDYKRYAELEFMDDSPLRLLQAIDAPKLAFFIIDPLLFIQDYEMEISDGDMVNLNANKMEDIMVRAIVTIPENPYDMTANLQGPLVINCNTKLAKQIVNSDQKYTTKHKVLVNPEASPVNN